MAQKKNAPQKARTKKQPEQVQESADKEKKNQRI